ncbi:2-oxoglutarate dehydrogenase E1 component [Limnoglobus roseus]|uniref:2-oxoglutarate dehydrogenase E1 component n=1 Tax=Limnoglobus roseus TaxID=2598579 RepID=A0A5C1AP39_9BACT|nr:2-oxoglutarate dehydrogenase E1 component [Limnoglobus roseus]QEL18984.1 2-oxoglutarate dehydrogenase E1 component [Limnoglobus roseus]
MAREIFANHFNRDLVEDAYRQWQTDPASVDATWQAFFEGIEFGGKTGTGGTNATTLNVETRLQSGAVRLITAYRDLGHLAAHLDPLNPAPDKEPWLISLERFHLSPADLDSVVDGSMYFGMDGPKLLRDVLETLKETYSRTIGVEYMHIQDIKARGWLAKRMEPRMNQPQLATRQKIRTLMSLHYAELFEKFLHTKFVGQKRFSLEGGETLLPILEAIVEKAPSLGVKEIVIGMAHRGRLNVLANILRKPFEEIFNEFEDRYYVDADGGDGDVKYHMGFSSDIKTLDGNSIHLSLAPNPSHLEIVNPVVEGRVRAKQQMHGDADRTQGVPILIHGDAAFAGQGLVAETLNMANLSGYRVGGTVHVVVNNQIGFTTSPRDSRSTQYCTDIAKFIQAPIFHVNAEDPEAAVYIAELALEYRQQYKSDVVIDLFCYRKWGHNEGDEPSYTQPVEYRLIRAKESVTTVYTKQLVAGGTLNQEEADAIDADFRSKLDTSLTEVRSSAPRKKGMRGFSGVWTGMTSRFNPATVETAIKPDVVDRIADQIVSVPDGFAFHPKLKDILEKRRNDIKGRNKIDWGAGEALAFGSLVLEGHPVRLSGQDSRRGTFSHRFAFLYDFEKGTPYCPLANLDPKQAAFDVYDSNLSEAAVLGFEYGYSLDDPNALVMWEAQFGDFANGAQVVIDQFISSGESKWNRSSGIVMLLPHGYEGAGPEHSSARFERFLQLCAEDNMQVCNFSTPANYFHALRRQIKRSFRKPLVVMTPKSLLRVPLSPVEDFTTGKFQEVIDDTLPAADRVRRVLFCTGKVYYDLLAKQKERNTDEVAVVRVEQLYPWPEKQLATVLAKYRRAVEWRWVQEESQNMGAWFFVEPRLRAMNVPVEYIGRDASASPATGSHKIHEHEQKELVEQAFTATGTYAVTAGKNGGGVVSHGVPV